MSSLPLHPLLVHLPLALAVLLPLVMAAILLAWRQSWLPRRTWILAVAGQALLVASGFVAMRSGENDEERVERLVPESAIEAHEAAAETFVWGGAIVLALALVPLLLRHERAARFVAGATVVGTVGVLLLGFRVGEAGGELVYRHGAAVAFTAPAGVAAPAALPADRGAYDDDH